MPTKFHDHETTIFFIFQNARAGIIYITLHYITLHYITLHYIIYRYGFTLVFCNLHCIHYHGKLQLALYIYISVVPAKWRRSGAMIYEA